MNKEAILKHVGVTALENLPIFISVHDTENNILWANRCYRETAGLSLAEMEGRKCYAVWGLEKSCDNCPAITTFKTGETSEAELTAEGQDQWPDPPGAWFSKVQPIRNDAKEVVGAVVVAYDITEQKRTEKALRESERRMATLLNNLPGMAYRCLNRPEWPMKFVSEGCQKLTGHLPEELTGADGPHYGDLIHPEDRQFVWDGVQNAVQAGTSFILEYRLLDKEGTQRWVWERGRSVDTGGDLAVLEGFITDITELKRGEEEREKLRAQYAQAQKMESVGRLAGGVAHDYNNMLSVIIGHTEMAMDETGPDEPLYANLKEIFAAANRSKDITRQLLAFARKQTIAPKVLDLNDTVAQMLRMLQRLIGEDIGLDWLPGDGIWPVKMDASQIDQILANLCVNARDAISENGKITIETNNVTLDETFCAGHVGSVPGEFVLLTVCDDGCGMDQETRASIFEPFFSTKDVNEGSGLGLATVYGIVKQNDGFIGVNSEPEKGTTFRLYLPRHMGEAGDPYVESTAQAPLGHGETVLLVEDEPTIMKLGRLMLEKLGYRAVTASTPSEAMRQAAEQAGGVQLLITDVVMPEMNGRELANHLHKLYPEMKILFMSGYPADVIAHRGVLDDGVDFVQKPFSLKDLGVKISATLGRGSEHA